MNLQELIDAASDILEQTKRLDAANANSGKNDIRSKVFIRHLTNAINFSNNMQAKDSDERISDIGKITKAAVSYVAPKKQDEEATVSKGKIGEVVKAAETKEPEPAKKEERVETEDAAFIESIKARSLENLSGTQFSKSSLIQIVKRINDLDAEAKLEIQEEDTKAIIAQKIFNYLQTPSE